MSEEYQHPTPSLKRRSALQSAAAIALCGLAFAVAWRTQDLLVASDLRVARQQQREAALFEADSIRFRLEAETVSTFYLVTSLASYISLNPDLTAQEFDRFAEEVFTAKPGLVSIAAAPDMILRFIYPREGNEAALGLNYRTHPEQSAAAMKVKETGRPLVAGPLELVQGGTAVIGRFPVYAEEEGRERFWGIISTPLYTDALYRAAGLLDSDLPLDVALRGVDGLGAEGEVFWGDPALFSNDALLLRVGLVGDSSWQMGVLPKGGWASAAPNELLIRSLTWLLFGLFVVIAALVHFYVLNLVRRRLVERSVSEAKSRFLANMSHEIRTPLNGISGLAQLLRLSEQTPDQSRLTNTIISSAKALSELLTDILNLSRLESGRYVEHNEPIDLASCLEPVLDLARIETEKRELTFDFDGVPESRRHLMVDVTAVRQILWNLLSNAVKFTPSGAITLKLGAIRMSGGRDGLRIEVIDTGIGIAAERQAAIFEDFVQEDDSTTRTYGGAGLGLAIVRRLVEALDGRLELRSRKGEGSRFVVDLPVTLVDKK